MAQEALTNARKHARTQRIRVALLCTNNETPRLKLEVQDWGQGFIPEEKLGEIGRVGLQGMAGRVNLLDGQFNVFALPDEGTPITASFAIPQFLKENIAPKITL